jgi:hypothetical protein
MVHEYPLGCGSRLRFDNLNSYQYLRNEIDRMDIILSKNEKRMAVSV